MNVFPFSHLSNCRSVLISPGHQSPEDISKCCELFVLCCGLFCISRKTVCGFRTAEDFRRITVILRMSVLRTLVLLAIGATVVLAQRRLALPDPRSCANRVRHATYRDARGVAHSYFFSWEHNPTRNLEVDWLDARNICRRHCMDAVSMETPQENEFIKQRIARGNVRYIWTSGRKCNFAGCDRPDLQPPNENGWFWSGSGVKIGPTTQRNTGDWSYTGGYGQQQPDNREAAQGNDESCLSILNNFYNDGLKWHDVACHHLKPFVCEDSDELLNFVRSRNPGIRL